VTSSAPRASLPTGSLATNETLPHASDNAPWITAAVIASCVIGVEPIAAALDSATQLITVVIVLVLVRTHPRRLTTGHEDCQAAS
jgi:hypothetical protein